MEPAMTRATRGDDARVTRVTPHVTRVTRAARHASTRARHHRASRASSPVPPPPLARARALRRRRSLDRSVARTRCGVGGGGGGQLHRAPRASDTPRASLITHAQAHIITPLHARHHRFLFPPRTTGTSALLRRRRRSLDRSIARTRCGVGDGGGGRLHRARASRARTHAITAHRARLHRPLPRRQPCARAAFARSLICCCVRRHAAYRTCARDLGRLVVPHPHA